MNTDSEKLQFYKQYIKSQLKGYLLTGKVLAEIIEKLNIKNAKISGRIKCFTSVKKNDGTKKVDDCFGYRIIANDEELEKIMNEVSKNLKITKIKDHRKKKNTHYEAIHHMGHMDYNMMQEIQIKPEEIPLVEIQYWNNEVYRNCYFGENVYEKYKKIEDKTLINITDAYKEVLKNPNTAKVKKLYNIPIYYIIEGTKIKELNKLETLEEVYPFLRKYKEKNRETIEQSRI